MVYNKYRRNYKEYVMKRKVLCVVLSIVMVILSVC